MEQKIYIPTTCKHTEALRVMVEPPSSKMYIQLCNSDSKLPFQEGKIEGRRGSEIAIFMFRPMKIIEIAGKPQKQEHLKVGENVLVKVQVFDKEGKKHEAEESVLVT